MSVRRQDDEGTTRPIVLDMVLSACSVMAAVALLVWLTAADRDPVIGIGPLVAMVAAWLVAGLASMHLGRR